MQLGLVEGMWDLKSGRLQFKSCLCCSQLYDLGSIIPGSLSFLLCKIRALDPSLWGLSPPRVPAQHTGDAQLTLLPPGFLLLFSYCPATAAGVSLPGGRGRRGWRQPLPRLCWSRSPAWARALGSRPGDSCAYKAAEAAEAGGGPGSGRYFGPGLPPPDPVSLGSLGGGTLEFYFWAPPSSLFASLPSPGQRGGKRDHSGCPWEAARLWLLTQAGPLGLVPPAFPLISGGRGCLLLPLRI